MIVTNTSLNEGPANPGIKGDLKYSQTLSFPNLDKKVMI